MLMGAPHSAILGPWLHFWWLVHIVVSGCLAQRIDRICRIYYPGVNWSNSHNMNSPLKEIPTRQLWIMDSQAYYAQRTIHIGTGRTRMCCSDGCWTQLCRLQTAQGHLDRRQAADISPHSSGQSFFPSAGLCPPRQNAFSPPPSPVSRTGPPTAPSHGALILKPFLTRNQPKCSRGLEDHLKHRFTFTINHSRPCLVTLPSDSPMASSSSHASRNQILYRVAMCATKKPIFQFPLLL